MQASALGKMSNDLKSLQKNAEKITKQLNTNLGLTSETTKPKAGKTCTNGHPLKGKHNI